MVLIVRQYWLPVPPLQGLTLVLFLLALSQSVGKVSSQGAIGATRPNVVLIMADDLGWGDVGFNGNQVVQTPHLDAMANNGLVFDRFYAAAPVCSPTRGSCLTGRHPYRYGIRTANSGHLPESEWTVAECLRQLGYRAGHFGKWHLGTLTLEGRDSNRGGDRNHVHHTLPTSHGFDVFFSTEAKVPTWDPMWGPKSPNRTWWFPLSTESRKPYGTSYWTPEGRVEDALDGDDSASIMDQALAFMADANAHQVPFLTVIWFHAPHLPVVTGKKWSARYQTLGGYHQHYYGCISALDHQVGRLRSFLKQEGLADQTMIWFASDNGPEGRSFSAPGSAWPFRGRKRSLLEGGIRVPAIVEWPARVSAGRRTRVPAVTSDYLPTIADFCGVTLPDKPYDGISLRSVLVGSGKDAPSPIMATRVIGFQSGPQVAWMKGAMKYYSPDQGKTEMLFDLEQDPEEAYDLSKASVDLLNRMRGEFERWQVDCQNSAKSIR